MFNIFKRKKHKYEVDLKTADNMLQNVFAACDTQPNTVPFEHIVKRSQISMVTDNIYIIVTAVIFVITLLLPLFLPHSDIRMSADHKQRELTIVSHSLVEGEFAISFAGTNVDSAASYMEDSQGNVIAPLRYDKKDNLIVFPFESGDYNIYIYDIDGNCLHLLLSPVRK